MFNRDYTHILPQPQLDLIENLPETDDFLKREILHMGATSVADIGGGANPALDADFVRQHNIDYALLDISQVELDKAPSYFRKIHVDLTASSKDFSDHVGEGIFDIILSHWFLEHVQDPLAVHRNIHTALKAGGLAIHIYPTPNNIPLAVNRLLPEWVGEFLISIAQPMRDRKGMQRKFPAFYAMCGSPSKKMHAKLQQLGFDVLRHTGYIGHGYYDQFAPLRQFERALRPILLKAKIPLTSDALLVLRKRPMGVGAP
jgi:SAM-dependent methyltransferase